MQIEPEAIFSLFETLYLPQNKEVTEKVEITNQVDVKPDISMPIAQKKVSLCMVFDTQYDGNELIFLEKILTAIQVKLEDIEINYALNQDSISEQITITEGKIVIWGLNFENLEKYKPIQKGKALVILTDSLGNIMKDQQLKAKLWECLRAVFVK